MKTKIIISLVLITLISFITGCWFEDDYVEPMAISSTSLAMKVGDSDTIEITGTNRSVYTISAESSNKNIVTIKQSEDNKYIYEVDALKIGTAILKFYLDGGSYKDSDGYYHDREDLRFECEVTVSKGQLISSDYWGTWIQMDTGDEFYIDSDTLFEIDGYSNGEPRLRELQTGISGYILESENVLKKDSTVFFRKGGKNRSFSVSVSGFSDSLQKMSRAGGTSLLERENVRNPSDSEQITIFDNSTVTMKGGVAGDPQSITVTDGRDSGSAIVTPKFDGEYIGTIPIIDSGKYAFKTTYNVSNLDDEGFMFGNYYKWYNISFDFTNIGTEVCSTSMYTISWEDSNLKTENLPIDGNFSSIESGKSKQIEGKIQYGFFDDSEYKDVRVKIEITDSEYMVTWVDYVTLRFYKEIVTLNINARNFNSSSNAILKGFLIYPDKRSKRFTVKNNTTVTMPWSESDYFIVLSGATSDNEMCYSFAFDEVALLANLNGTWSIEEINAYEKNDNMAGAYRITDYSVPLKAYLKNNDLDYYIVNNSNLSSSDVPIYNLEMIEIPNQNFELSQTQVTQGVYEEIMGENPSYFPGVNNPVEKVSWYDAIYFCNKLSEEKGYKPVYSVDGETDVLKWNYTPHLGNSITGSIVQNGFANGYRLPTVEEWQYAAKGSDDYIYAGSDNIDDVAWYDGNSEDETHPVAHKIPNGYGLYDMSGNVWEWCWDAYDNSRRYHLGGSYYNGTSYADLEYIGYNYADDRYSNWGFRVARTINNIYVEMIDIPEQNFEMSKTEITQAVYEKIMGENPSYYRGLTNPINTVSWYDAIYFCNKLSVGMGYEAVYSVNGETDVSKWNYTPHHGYSIKDEIIHNDCANGYKLPSVTEWQYAAKGGDDYIYAGSDNVDDVAWYNDNSNRTQPVATKSSNGYGLYDMSGNVSEWCWDDYGSNEGYYCGGSYYNNSENAIIERFGDEDASSRYYNFGFRIVRKTVDHNFEIKSNEDYHWKECSCGETTFSSEHLFVIKNDDVSHWQECECGQIKELMEHAFVSEWYDDTYHLSKCSGCEEFKLDEHSYVDSFCDCGVTVASDLFVTIPSGSFKMGGNADIGSDSKPVHDVIITKSFLMGKYEVTQAEWQCIMGENPSYFTHEIEDEKQKMRPVDNVSWYEVIIYCNKRSIKEGFTPCYSINGTTDTNLWGDVPTWDNTPNNTNPSWDSVVCNWNANGYRLPTEAEWEYAARAGDNTVDYLIWSGVSDSSNLDNYAWYRNNSSTTHQVGKKLPNEYGLYDMTGNVWEWCWDWYNFGYEDTSVGVSDPLGPHEGLYRVWRGGGYDSDWDFCQLSIRQHRYSLDCGSNLGFRLVRAFE